VLAVGKEAGYPVFPTASGQFSLSVAAAALDATVKGSAAVESATIHAAANSGAALNASAAMEVMIAITHAAAETVIPVPIPPHRAVEAAMNSAIVAAPVAAGVEAAPPRWVKAPTERAEERICANERVSVAVGIPAGREARGSSVLSRNLLVLFRKILRPQFTPVI
jgi:hypothetical protein